MKARWNALPFKIRNPLTWAGILLLAFLAYRLSVRKTVEAWSLNRQLHAESLRMGNGDQLNSRLLEQRSAAYHNIRKGYRLVGPEHETRTWQQLSALALAKGVEINFSAPKAQEPDTTLLGKHLLNREFLFRGKFSALVQFVDTLEKSSGGIGRIGFLSIQKKKQEATQAPDERLEMKLIMQALLN